MEFEVIVKAIISILLSLIIFFGARFFFSRKLSEMQGTQKLVGLIFVIILGLELTYLGVLFDFFSLAASVIASVGVAFALVSFALQNHLKNIVSGIGLYLNPRISIGDLIEIDGKKGTITEFHLMRTIALTDDGVFMNIPNLKFTETLTLISHRKQVN
ncbi:MAG: mechanosensitive ion channel family protein [Nitrosopumilus sp.]|nr:mechanosensitive ion channel family protein [Nitrosopumilus sp.]MDH3385105.1 mechanosensitive ion channel family protein [Nitrosopumilus sp.]